MGFKTSFSQSSTYVACPRYWWNSYNEKWKSEVEAASLYFGTAVDASIMAMLENKPDYMAIFKDRWRKAFQYGKATPIFDNPDIVYNTADFDDDVLLPKDLDQMLLWAAELKVGDGPNPVDIFKEIAKIKKNPYKRTSDAQMKYFSRCSWLSMKRKGEVLINSFKDQFLPKIKVVHTTQKYAKIEGQDGDLITGYIDMILEIEGYDKPVIFDLKTAARPYEQSQIDLTEQLTLYAAMKANEYQTDLVGYVVLCKNIPKETVAHCKSCGHTKDGRHQTCNNMVEREFPHPTIKDVPLIEIKSVRCEGEWLEKTVLKPIVQVLVERKTPEQVEELLKDYSNIILAMKNRIVYKNTSKCLSWYGSKCVFYDLCHKGVSTGLKKG
jgi:hypothetical protein